MKRFAVLSAAICLLALLTGCCSSFTGALRGNSPAPIATLQDATMDVEPTITPEETETPVPTENGIEYASANLGIEFTLPTSWAGKFRVQENDSSLSVYFAPQASIDDGMGKFFTIMRITDGDEDSFFDDSKIFQVNGMSFVFGGPTDVTYSDGDPEYDTFVKMQADLPAIFQSIKAAP